MSGLNWPEGWEREPWIVHGARWPEPLPNHNLSHPVETATAIENGDYPEDHEEQGWCCRECAVMAWYGMSLVLRREFAAEVVARRDAEARRQADGQMALL